MRGSRRQVMGWLAPLLMPRAALAQTPSLESRIARHIEVYAAQGDHLTGSDVDRASANWLAGEIEALGAKATQPTFTFPRVVVDQADVVWDNERATGVPLYDGGLTAPDGVTGRAGAIGSDADIGVLTASPFPTDPGLALLQKARLANRHRAIVVVTDPSLPPDGVAPINADAFDNPFGPPVLQIANRHWPSLQTALTTGTPLHVTIQTRRVETTAMNVQTEIAGRDPNLAPIVVMTPRSGWGPCAGERGGGLAAFLEILRRFRAEPPLRRVVFTANSGHEIGHLGLRRFLRQNKDLLLEAEVWVHLGANFAAAKGRQVWLQYSSAAWRSRVLEFVRREGLAPDRDVPVGTPPLGEAKDIAAGSGAYVSILGGHALFHHPADRWPDAVDVGVAARWVKVFAAVAQSAANQP